MDQKRRFSFVARIGLSGLAACALLMLTVSTAFSASASSQDHSHLKNFQHVFVIMMENTGYDSLIGNANAPWINVAASTHALAPRYSSVTHPIQPSYIAA